MTTKTSTTTTTTTTLTTESPPSPLAKEKNNSGSSSVVGCRRRGKTSREEIATHPSTTATGTGASASASTTAESSCGGVVGNSGQSHSHRSGENSSSNHNNSSFGSSSWEDVSLRDGSSTAEICNSNNNSSGGGERERGIINGNDGSSNNNNNDEEEEEGDGSLQQQQGQQPDPWKNRNVQLSLLFCVFAGVADSIWAYVVLSGFLYDLIGRGMHRGSERNELVGLAEAVQGITMLVFALPVGVLADLTGKARVVAAGGALMIVAIALTLYAITAAVQSANQNEAAAAASYRWILASLAVWGIVSGISYGPSQALFADSIVKGRRSEMYTYLQSAYLLTSAAGPLLSVFLLLSSGKEIWSMEEIYPVFVAGMLLELPGAVISFFFSDKHVVAEDDQDNNSNAQQQQEQQQQEQLPAREQQQQQRGGGDRGGGEGEEGTIAPNEGDDLDEDTACCSSSSIFSFFFQPAAGKAAVPYILFASSVVISLGAGASVKYFPLFFKELGFSTAAVQGFYVITPVSITAFSFAAQRASRWAGRIETSVVFYLTGVTLMLCMTYLSRNEGNNMSTVRKYVIVLAFLFRTGIMNASYPLLESVLMDAVPSHQRARWKSLESIAAFGWTGSALAGGILADERSYRFTFNITAALQCAGAVLLLTIRPFVEPEEIQQQQQQQQHQQMTTTTTMNDDDHSTQVDDATAATVGQQQQQQKQQQQQPGELHRSKAQTAPAMADTVETTSHGNSNDLTEPLLTKEEQQQQ